GRHTPFFTNYRPQFYFRTTDVTGIVHLKEGVEMIMPGDNAELNVELITPIAMEEKLRFAIREAGRTVGAGVVSKITACGASGRAPPRGEHRPPENRTAPGAIRGPFCCPTDRATLIRPRSARPPSSAREGRPQTNRTLAPGFTAAASCSASQLVRRTQPLEAVLAIFDGSGEPWMP